MSTKIIALLFLSVCASIPEINAHGFPDICSLPLETGMCRAGGEKWGYDSKAKKCVTFPWGGCDDGNENRFNTEKECQQACPAKPEFKLGENYDVIPGECSCHCPKCNFLPEITLRSHKREQSEKGNARDFSIHFPRF